jgi:lactose/L-arabinose transport system substrate-binding protein
MGRLSDAEPDADGPHAANLGGSSLAITIGVQEQGSCLGLSELCAWNERGPDRDAEGAFGLVPSLMSAVRILRQGSTALLGRTEGLGGYPGHLAEDHSKPRHAFPERCRRIYKAVQTKYFSGGYPDAKAALDDAASQIAAATGLAHQINELDAGSGA